MMKSLVAAVLMLVPLSSFAGVIYTVEDGINTYVVTAIESTVTPANYYNYNQGSVPSGFPAFGAEKDKGFFWLLSNPGSSELSLGMIWDAYDPNGTPDLGGTLEMTSSGFPVGFFVSVEDDRNATSADDQTFNGNANWIWNDRNSDGAMISGLGNSEWSIDLAITNYTGLDDGFFFVDGTGAKLNLDGVALGNTLTITRSVPGPASALVLLVGLALLSRRNLIH